jgi:hypothetical protein
MNSLQDTQVYDLLINFVELSTTREATSCAATP